MKGLNILRPAIILSLVLVLLTSAKVFGQDVKDRMRARLPEIAALKAAGVVGEDNQGFLGFPGGAGQGADVVAAENADRRQVYAAIAGQQGTSPDMVGSLRARQIAEKSSPGEWLQNDQGKWYRK